MIPSSISAGISIASISKVIVPSCIIITIASYFGVVLVGIISTVEATGVAVAEVAEVVVAGREITARFVMRLVGFFVMAFLVVAIMEGIRFL